MFHSISWQSYWLTLALLTAGYYGVLYLLYFRSDFRIWFHRRSAEDRSPFTDSGSLPVQRSGSLHQPSLFEEDSALERVPPGTANPERIVYSCLDELTAFFVEAKRRKWAKEELVQALRGILQKYPTLKASEYKESLTSVVVTQSELHCSIHLNREDTVRVW